VLTARVPEAPGRCVSLAAVDATQALDDLTEISPQIEAAVIFAADGSVEGSTLPDEERSREVARLAGVLLEEAGRIRAEGSGQLTQLQAQLRAGSTFVVREGDHSIAATTGDEPTVGLVFYDLRSTLRSLAEGEEEGTGGGAS
jgi:predicted regulator of Ras-like GTPase activity (Roadblock/LC7/MglB family)